MFHVVVFGTKEDDWVIVPPDVLAISNLTAPEASAVLFLKRPWTSTTLTVSVLPIPEASISNKSSWFKVELPLKLVASSGVTSLTLVKLLPAPAVPPATRAMVMLLPAVPKISAV